jgi:hypothetical protein
MKMIRRIFLFGLLAVSVYAQQLKIPQIQFSPLKYVCYQAATPIKIDGVLNDADWQNAVWTSDFVDIEGSLKPSPRFKTKVKMLWDKDYFYIAAELEEPHIWANLTNRDDIIFFDNDFEVFIDPDGDTKSYFEFEMNALNTVWDLLLTHPYRDVDNAALHQFDVKGLKSGVAVYGTINNPNDKDSCWTLEIAFPWNGFKEISDASLPPIKNHQWRINFSRVEWQTQVSNGKYSKIINPATNKPYPEDNWVWSPQGVVNMHYPEMWGYVQFSESKAGSGTEQFFTNKDEQAKWFLRNIYYNERNYFDKNGKYTASLKKLNINRENLSDYKFPPVITITDNMFEAYLTSKDGQQKIVINNEGYVYKKKAVDSSSK